MFCPRFDNMVDRCGASVIGGTGDGLFPSKAELWPFVQCVWIYSLLCSRLDSEAGSSASSRPVLSVWPLLLFALSPDRMST